MDGADLSPWQVERLHGELAPCLRRGEVTGSLWAGVSGERARFQTPHVIPFL